MLRLIPLSFKGRAEKKEKEIGSEPSRLVRPKPLLLQFRYQPQDKAPLLALNASMACFPDGLVFLSLR